MDILISRTSDLPIHRQLSEQIVVLISTGQLAPGEPIPTVRELARRKQIHYNTVSRAYQLLVEAGWLIREKGKALKVRHQDSRGELVRDLDDVIDATIRLAWDCGYTTDQLAGRIHDRLGRSRPDHVLVVSTDPGIQAIIKDELKAFVGCPVQTCSPDDLAADASLADKALIVCIPGAAANLRSIAPRGSSIHSITVSSPDKVITQIRNLKRASTIGVVSVSKLFLERAMGMLAPLAGGKHSLVSGKPSRKMHTDLVVADHVAAKRISNRNVIIFNLLTEASLARIRDLIRGTDSEFARKGILNSESVPRIPPGR